MNTVTHESHVNQEVVFPQIDVRIRIVSVKGKRVRLEIDAPPDVDVLRSGLTLSDDQQAHFAEVDRPLDELETEIEAEIAAGQTVDTDALGVDPDLVLADVMRVLRGAESTSP